MLNNISSNKTFNYKLMNILESKEINNNTSNEINPHDFPSIWLRGELITFSLLPPLDSSDCSFISTLKLRD